MNKLTRLIVVGMVVLIALSFVARPASAMKFNPFIFAEVFFAGNSLLAIESKPYAALATIGAGALAYNKFGPSSSPSQRTSQKRASNLYGIGTLLALASVNAFVLSDDKYSDTERFLYNEAAWHLLTIPVGLGAFDYASNSGIGTGLAFNRDGDAMMLLSYRF